MKLNKLHVLKHGAGSKRHGDTVPGGIWWIRRASEDLPSPACAENHRASRKYKLATRDFIEHHCAATASSINCEIDGKVMVDPLNVLLAVDLCNQRANHLVACRIAAGARIRLRLCAASRANANLP